MLNLILCEGKDDAIIISYILMHQYGWKLADNKEGNYRSITPNVSKNQSAYWYVKGESSTLICGVNGNAQYKAFFEKYIEPMQLNNLKDKVFNNIIFITDRDKNDISNIENYFSSITINKNKLIVNNCSWKNNFFENKFGEKLKFSSYLLVIPSEYEGALESVILDSIAENENDIVIDCKNFVNNIKTKATKFLKKDRDVIKAKLGVTFAIMSPMKVFTFIDELLKDVEWNKSSVILNTFNVLSML